MGLDMYLYRVPKVDSIEELEEINNKLDEAYYNGNLTETLREIGSEKKYIYDIDFSIDKYVDVKEWVKDKENWGHPIDLYIRVAYWRKFNALHSWFVKNVQGGEDNCEVFLVTEEHLKLLSETLEKLTEANAEELFPPQAGFFFGSTELGEWYWRDVESLKATVAHLRSQGQYDTTLVYRSSW